MKRKMDCGKENRSAPRSPSARLGQLTVTRERIDFGAIL